jgi:hypothetical protein
MKVGKLVDGLHEFPLDNIAKCLVECQCIPNGSRSLVTMDPKNGGLDLFLRKVPIEILGVTGEQRNDVLIEIAVGFG